ncbi:MAG: 2-phosphosulfolactate phosphatase [Planctomycetaceae bacterium]
MSRRVEVHLLPTLYAPSHLRGGIAVVIDVLRASTTISTALSCGATHMIPCQSINDARHRARDNTDDNQPLLGGERQGTIIDGFDLDNSPENYTRARIGGRGIVFTTTNGTRALLQSTEAERVLIGSFVNLNAVLARLLDGDQAIHLVCAGTDGEISAEDVLFAGAVCRGLLTAGVEPIPHDAARLALEFFDANSGRPQEFLRALTCGRGADNLERLGLQRDIQFAATWDRTSLVPEYLAGEHQIRAMLEPERPQRNWKFTPFNS